MTKEDFRKSIKLIPDLNPKAEEILEDWELPPLHSEEYLEL